MTSVLSEPTTQAGPKPLTEGPQSRGILKLEGQRCRCRGAVDATTGIAADRVETFVEPSGHHLVIDHETER